MLIRNWSGFSGHRVELNAFTSDALIEWVEGKLEDNGITKVIPDEATLERAYRRAAVIAKLPQWVATKAKAIKVPDGLKNKVERALNDDPELSWDEAVAECETGRHREDAGPV